MPKKREVEKYFSVYSDWSIEKTMSEARNVARWNPWVAHTWMDECRNRMNISEHYELMVKYDRVATEINNFWRSLQSKRYYDKKEFWGGIRQPELIPLIFDEDPNRSLRLV